jgi:NADPH:quinone reductase-like Zn-dependent oxidoreductase
VCALLPGGGYAQFATAPQEQVLPIPQGWSAVEAATLPENAFTVWENIFRRGRLARGETILVHGGTSGLGSLTIMLARALGARAFATAGTDAKCAACLRIGAEAAFNYKAGDQPAVLDGAAGRRWTWCSTSSAGITCSARSRCSPPTAGSSTSPPGAGQVDDRHAPPIQKQARSRLGAALAFAG